MELKEALAALKQAGVIEGYAIGGHLFLLRQPDSGECIIGWLQHTLHRRHAAWAGHREFADDKQPIPKMIAMLTHINSAISCLLYGAFAYPYNGTAAT